VTESSLQSPEAAAVRRFAIRGDLIGLVAHDRGHIHDTYISTFRRGDGPVRRYLHQRMNGTVFTDLPALMHNVERVTDFLAQQHEHRELEALRLVRTTGGAGWFEDESGAWRTYDFVEGTVSYDLCPGPEMAHEAARAFGHFQARLLGLPSNELRETIPRFFSAPHRLEQLDLARREDLEGRVAGAAAELAFVDGRRDLVGAIERRLADGRLPSRVVHGDTKLNNVLFDATSGRARCVVDLDTCMPGWSLYDFGDLVRFTAATSTEDETDLRQVGMDLNLYRALVDGYLEGAGEFLSAEERSLMPLAARLVTLTIGMRFLADHLAGDVYFKIARPAHNLDRARTQLAMVASMEAQDAQMRT
jgi:N-acetylhexosamine 1-kinase